MNNRRAKAFYLSHGFQVTGNGASPEGDYEELSFFPV
ncbi:ribosomal protein S18 acetylase RimI-like enzyme [Rhizobium binae]|uniref:Ribosomal protein S18 acetylase RimI-like enzyme n=1 Tax=Rhizobium binae TaxID=1138190 RepID=A0ABV2MBX3_9HYPH